MATWWTAIDDLSQSITNIVLTPKGSVPTEPEKGCDVLGAIDKHPSIGIPYLTREIWDAITLWEPRVTIEQVEVVTIAFFLAFPDAGVLAAGAVGVG